MYTLDFLYKNKQYGAYQIKKMYNKHLLIGLGIVMVISFSSFIRLQKPVSIHNIIYTDILLSSYVEPLPPPPISKPNTSTSPKKSPTVQYTTPVIGETTTTPEIAEVFTKEIGVKEVKPDSGQQGNSLDPIIPPPSHIQESIEEDKISSQEETVDEKAKFIGNWTKYVERNLDINIPLSNGAPVGVYSVYVIFMVDEKGNISDVHVLDDPGYGIAKEAIRIIKKSPNWLPAKKNGQNIKSYHKQKITFLIQEY